MIQTGKPDNGIHATIQPMNHPPAVTSPTSRSPTSPPDGRVAMTHWFESPLGRFMLTQEQQQCHQLVPSGYYPSSLQVGQPSINFLAHIETGTRFFIGERALHPPPETAQPQPDQPVHCAIAQPSAMPFADKTHNLIILPHTLDFCADPHAVLREVNQILVPCGCVVIIGFNQLSIWGATRLLMKASKRPPWNGNYYRVGRVQDWLSLLGFELVGATMLGYQPPLSPEKWHHKLDFIEKAGARWWPGLGAVYVIVGRKQEPAFRNPTPARLRWHLLPGMVQVNRIGLQMARKKR